MGEGEDSVSYYLDMVRETEAVVEELARSYNLKIESVASRAEENIIKSGGGATGSGSVFGGGRRSGSVCGELGGDDSCHLRGDSAYESCDEWDSAGVRVHVSRYGLLL